MRTNLTIKVQPTQKIHIFEIRKDQDNLFEIVLDGNTLKDKLSDEIAADIWLNRYCLKNNYTKKPGWKKNGKKFHS